MSPRFADHGRVVGIDVDDFVRIWAAGAFSYDTSIGGSNTVPSFRLEKVELLRKD